MKFSTVVTTHVREVRKITEELAGSRRVDKWYERFMDALKDAHEGSWAAGRVLAGTPGKLSDRDKQLASISVIKEQFWTENFKADLLAGRYGNLTDGPLNAKAIQRRSMVYVAKTRGVANESFAINSPEEAWFRWALGGNENHCTDCPYLSSNGPYKRDRLPTHPGAGATACIVHCLCHLERDDGVVSFMPIKPSNYKDLTIDVLVDLNLLYDFEQIAA